MSWAAPGKASLMYPKRMLVSYFPYGAYGNGGTASPIRISRITTGHGGRAAATR